jgi:serine/threonine protein kinase
MNWREKSEMWSLGVILYEMVFSQAPFMSVKSIGELEQELIKYAAPAPDLVV